MPEDSSAMRQRPEAAAPDSPVPAYVFLAATVAFIIYGSLYPFDFVSPGLPVDRFFAEYHLFARVSDATDNFLLFVPLGVTLALVFSRPLARAAAALLSVLVLAIGIQLIQLYLPSRVASLADAFWNTVGMGAGFLIAARVRHAFRTQLVLHDAPLDRFAGGLVVLWLMYESFPFVPTLDIGLLREHVKSAVFAPPFEAMRLAQHALAAALAGIAAARFGLLRRPARGVAMLAGLALALEVMVPYGLLRRETLLGIALGLAGGYLVAHRRRASGPGLAFVFALAAYLITVLTPYRAQPADGGFTFTPFSNVLWNGVVNLVPPTAFEALAIGALLWSGMAAAPVLRARPALWSAAVVLMLAALEWVRVGVAGFHGDTTALAMAFILAPAAVAWRTPWVPLPVPEAPVAPTHARAALPPWLPLASSAAALTLAMWVVLQLPDIPFDLKNLFGDHALVGAAVFSLALLWIGGGAWLAARTVLRLDARRRRGALWAPLLVAGLALVSYVLVALATPAIMFEKIIGAPERLVRYLALYSMFTIPLVLALLAVPRRERNARVIVNCLCLLPFWVLAKFVVLDWAITDNITELVAAGGGAWLALLIVLFGANAAWLGACRFGAVTLLATALAAGAGWWLLNAGIEPVVVNNGRIFSGVQFLLGEDRTALLSAPALFARWCALYGAALAVVATGVRVARRLLPDPV